jgi:hypothetical protein
MKISLTIALLIFISISCTYEPTGIEPFEINLEEPSGYGVFLSDGTRIDSLDTLNIYHYPYNSKFYIKFSFDPGAYDDTRISFQLNGKEIYSSKSTNNNFTFNVDPQKVRDILEMKITYMFDNDVLKNLFEPITVNKIWIINYDFFPNTFDITDIIYGTDYIEFYWEKIDHPGILYYDLYQYNTKYLIKRFYPGDESHFIYNDFLCGQVIYNMCAYYKNHDHDNSQSLKICSKDYGFTYEIVVECKEYDHIRYEVTWNKPFSTNNFGKYDLHYNVDKNDHIIFSSTNPNDTSAIVDLGLIKQHSNENYIGITVLPKDPDRSFARSFGCSFGPSYNSDKLFEIYSFDDLLHTYDNSKTFFYNSSKIIYKRTLGTSSSDGIYHENSINNICLSENGDYFILTDNKKNIVIPDFENGTFESLSESLNPYNFNSKSHDLSVSNSGVLVISQYNPEYKGERSFKLYDVVSDKAIYTDDIKYIDHVGISFDGSRVLARDVESEQIILYELDNDGNVNKVNSIEIDPLKSDFKFIPNSDDFVVLNNGTLTVYDENLNLRSSVSTDCDKILDIDYTNNYIALFRNYKCLIYDLNTMELKYSTFVAYETVAFMDSYLYSHGVKQRIEY